MAELRDWHGRWTAGGDHHMPGEAGKAEAEHRYGINPAEPGERVVHIPTAVAKQYSRFNPYLEDGKPADADHLAYMHKLEDTIRTKGFDAFKNLPALEVGESGKHAVISDGNHRVWAAAAIGMHTIPVNLITGEDDDWAKQYGFPLEPHLQGMMRRH